MEGYLVQVSFHIHWQCQLAIWEEKRGGMIGIDQFFHSIGFVRLMWKEGRHIRYNMHVVYKMKMNPHNTTRKALLDSQFPTPFESSSA
jgi:hypothetical protein